MRISNRRTGRLAAQGIVVGAAAAFLAAGAAWGDGSAGARVTAVVGEAVTGSGRPIESNGQIADDEKISMGKDGGCSILVDDDALVEMCEKTAVALDRDPASGRRKVRLDAGEIRLVVEPRALEERIEVHTPAAIATILGTVVYFSVDPATGETTITSSEHKVRVESSDPNVKGSTIVGDLEQITLRPGEAPPEHPRRIDPEELARLGGCLVDFHALARNAASDKFQLDAVDRIAILDGEDASRSDDPGPAAPDGDPADDLVDPAEVCSPADCPIQDMPQNPRLLDGVGQIQLLQ